MGLREILPQDKDLDRRNTLCISRSSKRRVAVKDSLKGEKPLQEYLALKRERGEFRIHPAIAPVSLMSADTRFVVRPRSYAHQADRTLRPLARRRARTLRPLEVAIL